MKDGEVISQQNVEGATFVDRDDFLTIYGQALTCYQRHDYDMAWQMIKDFQEQTGMKFLLGSLLQAYILRAQKKYVSEIALLTSLVHDFAASEDRKRLADAWSLLGAAHRMLGESEAAVADFVQSAEIEPDVAGKLTEISNAIFSANAIEHLSAAKMQGLYGLYRQYLREMPGEAFPAPNWHHEKIRVGYLSADLRDHAVGQFVRPFFRDYDRAHFEVFVYQRNAESDFVTEELRRAPVQWRTMAEKNFAAIAQAVRGDEIDILVELGGHTAGNALPVFAYRPAKVQLCGIGYFNSTGIAECDGFLSDVYCAPEEHSSYFTERLLQLPHTHFCYQPYKKFPEPVPPPCQQKNYITFGSFNNFAKVNDGMLGLWRELLQQVPGSRLLLKHQLLGTEEGRFYTLSRLRKLQLPLERIELRPYSADYLREYGDMDIALDTSPYPGGLTTCEALYMGVPVVTLAGNRHGARFGKSFLCNLGLEELVADSPEQYVNIARTLAGDKDLLTALRQTLRRMMLASPLMDSKTYMQDVENIYQKIMMERE